MSAELDLEAVRRHLLAQRDALLAVSATGEAGSATVELDQSRVGRLSRMDALQSQAMAQATGQRREQALRRIAAALRRLDEGEYGYCLECGEAIAPGRLEADPAVGLCVACAGRAEAR